MGKEIATQVQKTQSPKQDKAKEKHPKTHINQINEDQAKKEKRIKRNDDNLRDLWDNVKCPNIWIIGVPEEEDKKKGHEKTLEE